MIVFGPVPSRRLGQSIGVNNITFKSCPYSCTYCQLGRTDKMQIKRHEFYLPELIYEEVGEKLKQLESQGKHADYISFVPDGEPTLDKNLGLEIDLLKKYGVKIAVICNASLLWMDDVKADLMKADWVSLKLDSVDEDIWRKIDRPHGLLKLDSILQAIKEFRKEYKGILYTETMLVENVNDSKESLTNIGKELSQIKPDRACILVPIRPPAEDNVKRPDNKKIIEAAKLLHDISGVEIEMITGTEEDEGFFFSEDIVNDLISTISVHPVRVEIIDKILEERGLDKKIIQELVKEDRISEYLFEGKKFYKLNT